MPVVRSILDILLHGRYKTLKQMKVINTIMFLTKLKVCCKITAI